MTKLMPWREADEAIRAISAAHPTLFAEGWKYHQRGFAHAWTPFVDYAGAAAEVATCLAYIDRCRIVKAADLGSYGLKHRAEAWGKAQGLSPYIANGCFILAALYRDVPMSRKSNEGPNCGLGISKKSVRELSLGHEA